MKNKDKIDNLKNAIIQLFENIKFKQFLTLNEIITTKILNYFYWILLLLAVLLGIEKFLSGNFLAGIFKILLFSILARIFCETIIVIFKIGESLENTNSKD